MKISIKFLLCAAIYGILGITLGMVMGAQENFTLMPVHAHLNLLGWVALTLYGLTYAVFPNMEKTKLANLHFYVANMGIILLTPSLAIFLLGNKNILPLLILGELCTLLSLIIYLTNVWQQRAD